MLLQAESIESIESSESMTASCLTMACQHCFMKAGCWTVMLSDEGMRN
jgi:hypothetical protein